MIGGGVTHPLAAATPVEATGSATTTAASTASTQALAFRFTSARALDDATYGKAVEVTFGVTNTGTTDGPFSFHVLDRAGKNFLDDEGEEMYTGCDSAVSQLQPGATTTCRTFMRLDAADIAKGESPAMPVTFQWGSAGPTFDGFTVPVLNLSHLAPTTPTKTTEPTPTAPATSTTPKPSGPASTARTSM